MDLISTTALLFLALIGYLIYRVVKCLIDFIDNFPDSIHE